MGRSGAAHEYCVQLSVSGVLYIASNVEAAGSAQMSIIPHIISGKVKLFWWGLLAD
jgi:hypothetical protein